MIQLCIVSRSDAIEATDTEGVRSEFSPANRSSYSIQPSGASPHVDARPDVIDLRHIAPTWTTLELTRYFGRKRVNSQQRSAIDRPLFRVKTRPGRESRPGRFRGPSRAGGPHPHPQGSRHRTA